MPGLPPVPDDVIRLEQAVECGGLTVTTGWWLQSPTNPAMDGSHAEALIAAFFSTVMPSLLGLMHTEASCTTCRLAVKGFVAEGNAPPNAGSWTGATAMNVASGLKWTMRASGRRGWSISYVPCCPSAFVQDHWRLSQTGYGTLRAQGLDMLSALNELPAPISGHQTVGTVRRKSSSGPLAASEFVAFEDVYPVEKLVTIARRIPPRGALLPL